MKDVWVGGGDEGWVVWAIGGGPKEGVYGRAMGLFDLVVEAVAGGSLIVFVGCCWEACRAVVRGDFRMMTVSVVLEVVRRSMIVEACLACLAGNWAGSCVVRWHTACCHSLLHLKRQIQRHRPLEVVSFLGVQSALARSVLRDYMPLAQVDVTAAVAVVLVAERWRLLQTALIWVGLGTNAPKPYFLLEDGSVSQSQSFPAVGQQDS